MQQQENFLSKIKKSSSLALCFLISFWFLYIILEKGNHHLISWDIFGYYLYLPQTFIYGDPGMSDPAPAMAVMKLYDASPYFYQAAPAETGNHIIMYSMGMAIIYAPFFFIAHFIAWAGAYPMDGFSAPYETMMLFGTCLYCVLGIFLLRKVLLNFFDEKTSFITIVLITIGTNFYFIETCMLGMSHIYLFVFHCLAFLQTINYHNNKTAKNAALLGFLFGMMALIRPTEIIVCLVPLLWGIDSLSAFKKRIRNGFTSHKKQLALFSVSGFAVGFIQLLYWKIYAGTWLFNSYTNPGEGFEFLHPHLFEFLFSFKKGWFIYTPLMAVACLGFYSFYRENKIFALPILVFTLVNVYVLSSWSNWWYAASFGQRPVMQSYVLLALPLGYFVKYVLETGIIQRLFFITAFCFFIFLNLFQTWQMKNYILSEYRMTFDYYRATFLRTTVPEGAVDLLEIDRAKVYSDKRMTDSTLYNGRDVLFQDFEFAGNREGGLFVTHPVHSGRLAFKINSAGTHAPVKMISYRDFCETDHAWLRITLWVYPVTPLDTVKPIVYASMFNSKGKPYKWEGKPLYEWVPVPETGKWTQITFDYLTPDVRTVNDNFCVSLYTDGPGEIIIDEIRVRAYTRKKN